MASVRALGWVLLFSLAVAVGCGGQQDTKQAPPTKADPTGTEGGRLPKGPKGS